MMSSQALALPPLLSCHWRYTLLSLATLSEEVPIDVTSMPVETVGGPGPRERARSYHTSPRWDTRATLGEIALTTRGRSKKLFPADRSCWPRRPRRGRCH